MTAKSALISNDWVVGLNTTAALGAWTLTGEIYHESSHLGDEYSDRFNASRLDWTREVAAAWLSYGPGPVRITGNLSYVLIDELDLDRPGAALAADYEGRPFGTSSAARCGRWAGSSSRGRRPPTGGSAPPPSSVSRCPAGRRREIGVALIAHDGLSTQRQFFRRESRYIGVRAAVRPVAASPAAASRPDRAGRASRHTWLLPLWLRPCRGRHPRAPSRVNRCRIDAVPRPAVASARPSRSLDRTGDQLIFAASR